MVILWPDRLFISSHLARRSAASESQWSDNNPLRHCIISLNLIPAIFLRSFLVLTEAVLDPRTVLLLNLTQLTHKSFCIFLRPADPMAFELIVSYGKVETIMDI